MGFPQKAADGPTAVAFVGPDCLLQSGGFTCPRCKARVVDLPSTCHVCGLTLVSSSQLARSYHHLFPVKPFVEVPTNLPSLVRRCLCIVSEMLIIWWAADWTNTARLVHLVGCVMSW